MKLKAFLNGMDSISEWSGRIFVWLIIPLTAVVVFEVFSRRVLNAPHIWATEVTNYIYGPHFMLVAAYTLLHRGHVSIDIFFQRLSKRWKGIIECFNHIVFFFPFCFIIFQQGIVFAKTSWEINETSATATLPVVPEIKTVIPVTFGLLLIQGLANFIRCIILAVKGEEI
jgi:TRAP-type mannitol/chloroaromatic compound transport system permease small subunit